jgi:hypothetical protein
VAKYRAVHGSADLVIRLTHDSPRFARTRSGWQ